MIIQVCDYSARGILLEGSITAPRQQKEQVCRDLHIGESIKLPGDDVRRPTPKKIRLKPNDCLRIETDEHLTVPSNVFGTICSRASLTAEGLIVANLKIDPKFQGKLTITIYNTSKNIITLNHELPFCSIFFQGLETPLPDTAPIRTPPEAKIISGHRIVETLNRALPFILTFGASVLASLIASYLFGWIKPEYKTSRHLPNTAIVEQQTAKSNEQHPQQQP